MRGTRRRRAVQSARASGASATESPRSNLAVAALAGLLCVASLSLAALAARHTPGLTGPSYWSWAWRDVPALRTAAGLLPSLLLFAVAQWRIERDPSAAMVPLAALTLSLLGLEVVAVAIPAVPFGLSRVQELIQNPDATSYFTDAARLRGVPDLLARFPEIVPRLLLHSRTKPPGPILFYLALQVLAPSAGAAARAGGLLLAAATAALVPATFHLSTTLGTGRRAALHAASAAVLWPALSLFFPQFDQPYPVVTCVILTWWARALAGEGRRLAAQVGALLAVACFFTFGLSLLVAALAAWTVAVVRSRADARRVVGLALVAAAVFVGAYVLLWIATGFDPVETFAVCRREQIRIAAVIHPPWPMHIVHDLRDFALGAGWALPAFAVVRALRPPGPDLAAHPLRRFLGAWMFVVGAIAVTGVLPVETSRLWLFLTPGFLVGAGLELADWPLVSRVAVHACMWVCLASLMSSIGFV